MNRWICLCGLMALALVGMTAYGQKEKRLKQPTMEQAVVETLIQDVEKHLIKTAILEGLELPLVEKAIEKVRANMVLVGHNPEVLDEMVSRIKGPTFLGTVVDGVYVMKSISEISALTRAEEKAAAAAGTSIGYLANVAGSYGVTMLGGGFLHGAVVSLSAKAISELFTEMVMLHYDRQDARHKERWADLEIRSQVIRGLLKGNEMIESGDWIAAEAYLSRVDRFAMRHSFPNDGIFEQLTQLRDRLSKARANSEAMQVLAEARVLFQQAYRWTLLGRNLSMARHQVEKAMEILRKGEKPGIQFQRQLAQCAALNAAIEQQMSEVSPMSDLTVIAPETARPGEIVHLKVQVTGGLPDYRPQSLQGHSGTQGAVFFWEAPRQPGVHTLTLALKDDLGKEAETRHLIEVVGPKPSKGFPLEGTWQWHITTDHQGNFVAVTSEHEERRYSFDGFGGFSAIYQGKTYRVEFSGQYEIQGRYILMDIDEQSFKSSGNSWYGVEQLRNRFTMTDYDEGSQYEGKLFLYTEPNSLHYGKTLLKDDIKGGYYLKIGN